MNGCCKFNNSVLCENHTACKNCGWNPPVFEERKRKQREKIALAKLKEQEKDSPQDKGRKWRFIAI